MSQNPHHPHGGKNAPPPHSPQSIKSIGMGDKSSSNTTPSTKPPPYKEPSDLPRPLPEGVLASNEPLYDCVVYVIYCPDHHNIAVTNSIKCRTVWLPFVPMPEGVTWTTASHDGVSLLIGRNDTEMDGEEAALKAPKYSMAFLNILRLVLPSKKVVVRLGQFVRLESNPNFECCRNTERVNWLPLVDIQTNDIAKLWGPELQQLTAQLAAAEQSQLVQEFTASSTVAILKEENSSWQQELLRTFKLTERHVHELFVDYIEHCYPSLYMCAESFRVYFFKYDIVLTEEQLGRLFIAFSQAEGRRNYIEFHELLIALVTMEPGCPSKLEARYRLIFRYYDFEQKGQLNEANIVALLKDANPAWSHGKLSAEARSILKDRTVLNYDEFSATKPPILRNLCRFGRSMLKTISWSLACKVKERARMAYACEGALKGRRKTKGTCTACQAQTYSYGNHMVTIDTAGRCVEPTLIPVTKMPAASDKADASKFQQTDKIARSRFSLEYIFAVGAVPNIFLDLVREFHRSTVKNDSTAANQSAPLAAMMSGPGEWKVFHKYIRLMVNEMSSLLNGESKLIKINAPAIVVGDVQGNLHDLLTLETIFWQSFPVVPESIIFLGNYSGEHYPFGLECLIYLVALKLSSPNKVYLIRGTAELDATSSMALKQQSIAKYGPEHGQIIFALLVSIFSRLPVAALLDDQILCTHSGIPSSAAKINTLLAKLPKEMASLPRNCPVAYEIITRQPKDSSLFDDAGGSSVSFSRNTESTSFQGNSQPGETIAAKSIKGKKIRKVKSGGWKSGGSGRLYGKSQVKSVKKPPTMPLKSIPLSFKMKSAKSPAKLNSLSPTLKCFDSTKSLKSLKSIGTKKTSHLPTIFEQLVKSNAAPKISTAAQSEGPYHFEINAHLSARQKPAFLRRYLKGQKGKVTKQKCHSAAPPKNKLKLTNRTKTPEVQSGKRRDESPASVLGESLFFDDSEFANFLAINELSCLIRSGSLCRYGFALTYSSCISLYSCSNVAAKGNHASVALVDGLSVRILRHSISCKSGAGNIKT